MFHALSAQGISIKPMPPWVNIPQHKQYQTGSTDEKKQQECFSGTALASKE